MMNADNILEEQRNGGDGNETSKKHSKGQIIEQGGGFEYTENCKLE